MLHPIRFGSINSAIIRISLQKGLTRLTLFIIISQATAYSVFIVMPALETQQRRICQNNSPVKQQNGCILAKKFTTQTQTQFYALLGSSLIQVSPVSCDFT